MKEGKPLLLATVGVIIFVFLLVWTAFTYSERHPHHQQQHHQQQQHHADHTDHADFQSFVDGLKKDATTRGVSAATIHRYLDTLHPPGEERATLQQAAKNSRHNRPLGFDVIAQDEFLEHLENFNRVQRMQLEYQRYRALLFQIYLRYHVPPGVILALWAIESHFGDDLGSSYIIQSLATLAYGGHRADYFRSQLLYALQIFDQIPVTPQMLISTFDGGMGQPDFEPETYKDYAVDFEFRGYSDIWYSHPDVFASIAHFLYQNGWTPNQTWGVEVKIPKDFPRHLATIHNKFPVSKWRTLGVTNLDGSPLKDVDFPTSIVLPGWNRGHSYLVYPNYHVLLRWNMSSEEALTAGKLWDQCGCQF